MTWQYFILQLCYALTNIKKLNQVGNSVVCSVLERNKCSFRNNRNSQLTSAFKKYLKDLKSDNRNVFIGQMDTQTEELIYKHTGMK